MFMFSFVIFVVVFFWMIRKNGAFFENKLRFVQVGLGLTLFLSIFLFISADSILLFLFFLFWALVAVGSFLAYQKYSAKIGFVGLSFCLFFTGIFVYLELFLLNFDF